MYTVTSIIITYNPNIQQINETVHSIINQVSLCIIIDNGNTIFNFQGIENIIIVNLGKNYGIAYAQNRGIELAQQHNADFIVLSDQDTIYPLDFIEKMISFYEQYPNKNKIGALVPHFFDKNKMCKTKLPITKFNYIVPDEHKTYKVAHAVSSGSFIPVKNFDVIGNMREELFIDWVDNEWCWRATNMGYEIICIPDAVIEHMMGDGVKKIRNKEMALRSKVRYYYMIRNGVYIIWYTSILNLVEKIRFAIDLILKAIGMCFIEKNVLPLLYKAFYDGITKRMYEIAYYKK